MVDKRTRGPSPATTRFYLIDLGRMKLLITGIPGTGKTTIGNYFASAKGYEHFEIEAILKRHGSAGFPIIEAFIDRPSENKVVTWGFLPVVDDALVRRFQGLGYRMFWLDGNREAARREFLKRGDVPVIALDNQMAKIEKFDLDSFKPIHINPFSKDGIFLEKEKIVEMILKSIK